MRVVGGTLGGRRLVVPAGRPELRPTAERVRGAIFNSLTSLGVLPDATVADLFAGSGALGIEALSRGAARATFVDRDRRAVSAIRRNVAALGLQDQAAVVGTDVQRWTKTADAVDLAFMDPPYSYAAWTDLLGALRAGLAVCESDRAVEPTAGWQVVRVKRHGGTVVTLLQSQGRPHR
jgi:16S rRNA (guanine966-N2)-methyltransferase